MRVCVNFRCEHVICDPDSASTIKSAITFIHILSVLVYSFYILHIFASIFHFSSQSFCDVLSSFDWFSISFCSFCSKLTSSLCLCASLRLLIISPSSFKCHGRVTHNCCITIALNPEFRKVTILLTLSSWFKLFVQPPLLIPCQSIHCSAKYVELSYVRGVCWSEHHYLGKVLWL